MDCYRLRKCVWIDSYSISAAHREIQKNSQESKTFMVLRLWSRYDSHMRGFLNYFKVHDSSHRSWPCCPRFTFDCPAACCARHWNRSSAIYLFKIGHTYISPLAHNFSLRYLATSSPCAACDLRIFIDADAASIQRDQLHVAPRLTTFFWSWSLQVSCCPAPSLHVPRAFECWRTFSYIITWLCCYR